MIILCYFEKYLNKIPFSTRRKQGIRIELVCCSHPKILYRVIVDIRFVKLYDKFILINVESKDRKNNKYES